MIWRESGYKFDRNSLAAFFPLSYDFQLLNMSDAKPLGCTVPTRSFLGSGIWRSEHNTIIEHISMKAPTSVLLLKNQIMKDINV